MAQKILITGANSYLGSFISEYLYENTGYELILFHSLRAKEENFMKSERVRNIKTDLCAPFGNEIDELIKSTDKIFHFAWFRGNDQQKSLKQNKKMITQLINTSQKPENFYFISSVTGTPNTKSEYGKNKYKALQFVAEKGGKSIILGLVMEENPEKGPYKMLLKIAEKLPFSFRIRKNEPLVFPINKENFAKAILTVLGNSHQAKRFAFFQNPIGFNSFMQNVETKFPRKRIKFSFNAKLLLKVAEIAKKSKIVPVKICDQILTFFYKDADFLTESDILKPNFLTKE